MHVFLQDGAAETTICRDLAHASSQDEPAASAAKHIPRLRTPGANHSHSRLIVHALFGLHTGAQLVRICELIEKSHKEMDRKQEEFRLQLRNGARTCRQLQLTGQQRNKGKGKSTSETLLTAAQQRPRASKAPAAAATGTGWGPASAQVLTGYTVIPAVQLSADRLWQGSSDCSGHRYRLASCI